MSTTHPGFWKDRFWAAGIHLAISLVLALLGALLVFLVWYPYPYREISGGQSLFFLLVSVDVVMGPLMTLAIFNRLKPVKELRRDLAVIGLLQLAALAYGLWTVAVSRPVHLVFEVDRFRVVHAIDVPPQFIDKAPPELRTLPWTGPTLLSVRGFKDANESFDATMAALGGVDLGARPDLWQSYEKARPEVIAHIKPLAELRKRFPERLMDIDKALKSVSIDKHPADAIGYVPMVGRKTFWTVLIDRNTTEVLAFVPIDSF